MKQINSKPQGKTLESQENDILETAELVRAANCLGRMTVGVFYFAESLCGAKVFDESEFKSIQESLNKYLNSLGTLYASLMGRYSALTASKIGSKDELPKS